MPENDAVSRRTFLKGSAAVVAAAAVSTIPVTSSAAASAAAELEFASAFEAAAAIRKKKISSVELTKAVLARIDRFNPKLNAIVTLTADQALERARAADGALAKGQVWGAFHGVPCTIKDSFEVEGVRTTCGAKELANYVPKQDAVCVARYRKAGAVILGKTNVPTYAADWQSYNDIFGTTNNPWDVTRTPGGSSGGEAAAIASGLSYFGVGSDIGGSLRVPADFCGIYAHKSSVDVVPMKGHIPPPPGVTDIPLHLPVAGPLARNAEDLRALLEVLGGPVEADQVAYRWSLPAARHLRLSEFRVGYVLDDKNAPVSSEVRSGLEETVRALQKAGVKTEEGWPQGVNLTEEYLTYVELLAPIISGGPPPDLFQKAPLPPPKNIGEAFAFAPYAPHIYYFRVMAARENAGAAWREYFKTHDVFLMPVATVPAFPHDHSQPMPARTLNTPEGPRPYTDTLFWAGFATMTGFPATAAPVGFTSGGLPLGVQILGPWLEDATPIEFAAQLSKVIGGYKPPKGYA
ncbi:MAG TPA: amidase [Terriglobales bacterium]|nr:amidase [Terriglobales bacterium]